MYVNKKICIFSFFVFSKFVEQYKIQPIASYGQTSLYH